MAKRRKVKKAKARPVEAHSPQAQSTAKTALYLFGAAFVVVVTLIVIFS